MKLKSRRLLFTTSLLLTLSGTAAFAGPDTEIKSSTSTVSLTEPTDWLKVSGYANFSYTYTDYKSGENDSTFTDSGANNLDSMKVGFTATQGPLSAYVSLFYVPDAARDAGILDAYVTYKMGEFSITAGKYLSYLGYEAFDAVNMSQLTYANGIGAIPAYHDGIKFDYKSDLWSGGISISDSIRGGDGFFRGDSNYSDDLGFEAYFSYSGFKDLTIWAGIAYEDTKGPTETYVTYDLWASYKATEKLTLAAEAIYNNGGVNYNSTSGGFQTSFGTQYLAFASYAFTEKLSLVGRVGLDDIMSNGFNDVLRYTVAPSYSINKHLIVRVEATYSDVRGSSTENSMFYGLQGLLKF